MENMKTWNGGGGFSVNGAVRIHENDREGLERLLRYCARPPFTGTDQATIRQFSDLSTQKAAGQ